MRVDDVDWGPGVGQRHHVKPQERLERLERSLLVKSADDDSVFFFCVPTADTVEEMHQHEALATVGVVRGGARAQNVGRSSR